MSPWYKTGTLAERYDLSRPHMREDNMPPDAPRPLPTSDWPKGNIEFLEGYRDWLLSGGTSKMTTNNYHIMMAGHVFGLTLKPYHELDPDKDLECALDYVKAKGLGQSWIRNCRSSLAKFRRYLRLQRGLGEEKRTRAFDSARFTQGLPLWLVNELERYQHVMQRNWRPSKLEMNLHRFWCVYARMWRFLVEQRGVQELTDVKRQFLLDYVDQRLDANYAVSGVSADMRYFQSFLHFLQEEGYSVPLSLLRIPPLKQPDPLPKYLTDEQVKSLLGEIERRLREAKLPNRRRQALLDQAAFYLLWQCGMRLSEVEELRLEELDFPQKRLSVRNSKGQKDRTVYLTETAMRVLQAYLEVRGEGSSDNVFLYRHAPLSPDLIRSRLRTIGKPIGVKVYPHRLRHTCATQLLNAGCRVTSIQRFLGHKELNTTMIYARAHDQTVADDYFAAMQRVEQRLDILPIEQKNYEVVNVQEPIKVFHLIGQLELPELGYKERLNIAAQLRESFGLEQELEPVGSSA